MSSRWVPRFGPQFSVSRGPAMLLELEIMGLVGVNLK